MDIGKLFEYAGFVKNGQTYSVQLGEHPHVYDKWGVAIDLTVHPQQRKAFVLRGRKEVPYEDALKFALAVAVRELLDGVRFLSVAEQQLFKFKKDIGLDDSLLEDTINSAQLSAHRGYDEWSVVMDMRDTLIEDIEDWRFDENGDPYAPLKPDKMHVYRQNYFHGRQGYEHEENLEQLYEVHQGNGYKLSISEDAEIFSVHIDGKDWSVSITREPSGKVRIDVKGDAEINAPSHDEDMEM